MSRFYR